MSTDVSSAADLDLDMRPVDFAATDGVTLSGRWLRPPPTGPAPRAVVVVVCGAGIPARFYERLARHLALADAGS
jgi:predicted alpha/beta hydrolase